MTRDEFLKITAIMTKTYYREEKLFADSDMTETWYRILQDIDSKIALAAANKWVMTEEYPPRSPASFRKACVEISTDKLPSAQESWQKVRGLMETYGRNGYEEGYKAMTDAEKDAVNAIGGWSYMCNQSYASAFEEQKAFERYKSVYDERVKDDKTNKLMSRSVQNIVARIGCGEGSKDV